jgi:dTDP-4-dehydrorhamnose 3,5-epimerase
MINGVKVKALDQFHDERGKVMKLMTKGIRDVNEVYASCIQPNAIKGWHRHRKMILNYAVLTGRVKCVLYDDRDDSPTNGEINEFFIGPENFLLIEVPALIWNGFKGLARRESIIINCASKIHSDDEVDKLPPINNSIPYMWGIDNK